MVEKIPQLRIFADTQGYMNYLLHDIHGEMLLVSQFTLLANTAKERRPSFEEATPPEEARRTTRTYLNHSKRLAPRSECTLWCIDNRQPGQRGTDHVNS